MAARTCGKLPIVGIKQDSRIAELIGTTFALNEATEVVGIHIRATTYHAGGLVMDMRMDGWKVSYDGARAKMIHGPCWGVVTFFRSYDGREVPDSHIVESVHHDRPNLERLIEKYQYPAPGSVKQYDFAYGRMATAVAYRESPVYAVDLAIEDETQDEFVFCDLEDKPGMEKVFRKVEMVRLTKGDVEDLYLDWARTRILKETDDPSLEFALHVLAEIGGEV
jgi:hypothetical protein